MAACRDELTLTRASIEDYLVLVAEIDDEVVGFASLDPLGDGEVELGHLFVEPARIGEGHGRRLFEAASEAARHAGYAAMIVQGDPNAAGFYRRMGAEPIGVRPSDSIPGRELPLYRVALLTCPR
jgi:predicted N-acetyltransferase YhbS